MADGTSNVVEEPIFGLYFSDTERLSAAPNNKTGQDLNSSYPRNILIQFGHLPPPAHFTISELTLPTSWKLLGLELLMDLSEI